MLQRKQRRPKQREKTGGWPKGGTVYFELFEHNLYGIYYYAWLWTLVGAVRFLWQFEDMCTVRVREMYMHGVHLTHADSAYFNPYLFPSLSVPFDYRPTCKHARLHQQQQVFFWGGQLTKIPFVSFCHCCFPRQMQPIQHIHVFQSKAWRWGVRDEKALFPGHGPSRGSKS